MQLLPVCRQIVVRPSGRIRTVEAKRVSVMSIDIDCRRSTRSIVSLWRRIIADKRHNDAGIADLILDIGHVDWIGKRLDRTGCLRVLILRLNQNDWSSIRDLSFGNCGANVLHVTGHYQYQVSRMVQSSTYLSVAAKKSGARVLSVPLIRWIHPGKPPPETSALI